jgi:hypothetical protein
MVQRLSEEQILALTKPHSGGSQSHENHSENLKSAEFLQQTRMVSSYACTLVAKKPSLFLQTCART